VVPRGPETSYYRHGGLKMSYFSLDIIDFLIKMEEMEQKRQQNDQNRPFLELPVPYLDEISEKTSENDENSENTGEIVIDL
jgi:hypothetical protein